MSTQKAVLLDEVGEGPSNNTEMLDKFMVISHQAEEALEFFHSRWSRPIDDGCNFVRVGGHSLAAGDMAKISHGALCKRALGPLELPMISVQPFKYQPKMLQVFFICCTIHHDVVKEDNDESVKPWGQRRVHRSLKRPGAPVKLKANTLNSYWPKCV
jgi:hypothetical protein